MRLTAVAAKQAPAGKHERQQGVDLRRSLVASPLFTN